LSEVGSEYVFLIGTGPAHTLYFELCISCRRPGVADAATEMISGEFAGR
jgi:hypothetical protein